VIAIENVRLFEAEKQRTLALAQANRDLAEREAKIRRLVDSNIIGKSGILGAESSKPMMRFSSCWATGAKTLSRVGYGGRC
jgi:hypothetical protein